MNNQTPDNSDLILNTVKAYFNNERYICVVRGRLNKFASVIPMFIEDTGEFVHFPSFEVSWQTIENSTITGSYIFL